MKFPVASPQLPVWKLETGSWKLEAGSWKLEAAYGPMATLSNFAIAAVDVE
jgi:hypothetical protein